jgi:hypothetical protein
MVHHVGKCSETPFHTTREYEFMWQCFVSRKTNGRAEGLHSCPPPVRTISGSCDCYDNCHGWRTHQDGLAAWSPFSAPSCLLVLPAVTQRLLQLTLQIPVEWKIIQVGPIHQVYYAKTTVSRRQDWTEAFEKVLLLKLFRADGSGCVVWGSKCLLRLKH